MLYLSISVFAENIEVSVTNFWIIGAGSTTDTGKIRWNSISSMPFTFVSSPSNTITYIYLMSKMAEIPQDNQVLVWSIEIENTALTQNLALSEIGFIPESSVNSTISPAELNAINYNQNVIAKTIEKVNTNTVRYTTTVKIGNPNSQFIIWKFGTVGLYDISNTNRIITELNVYESIEDAAGSGTTPEEMREVLSSWSEEELLPGIQDSVQSGVASGMEEALQNEKQEASSEGGDLIDQIHGGLSGTFDDIEQATQSFTSLADALKYNGQTATLSVPAITLPFIGTISEGINWDMTGYIQQAFPSGFILLIRCIFSLGVVMYPILEITMQVQRLLDKGGK